MSKITELAEQIRRQSQSEQETIKTELQKNTQKLIADLNNDLSVSKRAMLKSIIGLNLLYLLIGVLVAVMIGQGLWIWYQQGKISELNDIKQTMSELEKYKELKGLEMEKQKDGLILALPIKKDVKQWKTKDYHVIKIK